MDLRTQHQESKMKRAENPITRRQSLVITMSNQISEISAIIISSDLPYQLMNRFAVKPAMSVKNKPHFMSFALPAHKTKANIKYIKARFN